MEERHTNSLGALSAGVGESVLVLASDSSLQDRLEQILSEADYRVFHATSVNEAFNLVRNHAPELLIFEDSFARSGEDEVFQLFHKVLDTTKIISLSLDPSPSYAVELISAGIDDVLKADIDPQTLLLTLKKALKRDRSKTNLFAARKTSSRVYDFGSIIGSNPLVTEILDTIKKIADYRTTVMLYGESGTGKELIAKAFHYNSKRRNKRFVPINCGAIPENLLESELFGHKKGAFTDALRDKKGLFEEAEGGTIFLDEIGELPTHLQVKLLRVLQENEIHPVGDSRTVPIDVRVIAATLRDLESDVIEGRFRDDLFYRLNVISIKIPPLRQRKDDIPMLVDYFLKKNRERLGLAVYGVSNEAMGLLMKHDWPGNIRELENCIERAMILTDSEEITVESLPKTVRLQRQEGARFDIGADNLSIKFHSRNLEETLIRRALAHTRGNRTQAARLLEISHRTLLYKLKEFGMDQNE